MKLLPRWFIPIGVVFLFAVLILVTAGNLAARLPVMQQKATPQRPTSAVFLPATYTPVPPTATFVPTPTRVPTFTPTPNTHPWVELFQGEDALLLAESDQGRTMLVHFEGVKTDMAWPGDQAYTLSFRVVTNMLYTTPDGTYTIQCSGGGEQVLLECRSDDWFPPGFGNANSLDLKYNTETKMVTVRYKSPKWVEMVVPTTPPPATGTPTP